MDLIWIGLGSVVAVYVLLVAVVLLAGHRTGAIAIARFVPDCIVLMKRLVGDPRVPRSRKLVLVGVAAWLVSPIDLLPEFLPVLGPLDDAVVVVLALRWLVRGGGPELVREHWPGPTASLQALLRLVCGPEARGTVDGRDADGHDDRADHDAPDGGVGDRGHRPRVAQAGRRRGGGR